MRKILYLLLLAVALTVFTACEQKEEKKSQPTFNPVNPGESTESAFKLKQNLENKVQEAVDEENKKNNNTFEESETSQSQLNDNFDLVEKYKYAVLKTNLGNIKLKFYGEDAPSTVGNFLKLSQDGFYSGTKFHRVIDDFMIQGGDPLSRDDSQKSKWGTGGPGYKFADEINSHKLVKGSLAMANSGPNTNGSQFFIVTKDSTSWLDGKHTNFGEVVDGMEVVEKIEGMETDKKNRPLEDVSIEKVELLEK